MGEVVLYAAAAEHSFELEFNADAGVDYRLWIRGKAQNDFWGKRLGVRAVLRRGRRGQSSNLHRRR